MATSSSNPGSFEESKKALNDLLNDLRDLDLTNDINDESPFLQAHGGYSDVFVGKCRKHNGMRVAIKRLRVHIMANKDVAKVRELCLVSMQPHGIT